MTRWLNHRLPGPLLEAHAYLGPGHSRRGAGLTGGRGSGRAGPVEADLELRKASGSERSAHVIPACSVDRRHAGPTSCLPSKSSNSSSNLNNSPSNTHDNSPTLAHSGAKRRGNNTCHSSPAGLRGSPWDVPCELGTCKDLVTSPLHQIAQQGGQRLATEAVPHYQSKADCSDPQQWPVLAAATASAARKTPSCLNDAKSCCQSLSDSQEVKKETTNWLAILSLQRCCGLLCIEFCVVEKKGWAELANVTLSDFSQARRRS